MERNDLVDPDDPALYKVWLYKLNFQSLQKLQQNPSNHKKVISPHFKDFFIEVTFEIKWKNTY